MAEDSRRFISQETGNLYISKVQTSDVGSYICLVKNTVTNARVLSPPTPLTLRNDGKKVIISRYHIKKKEKEREKKKALPILFNLRTIILLGFYMCMHLQQKSAEERCSWRQFLLKHLAAVRIFRPPKDEVQSDIS